MPGIADKLKEKAKKLSRDDGAGFEQLKKDFEKNFPEEFKQLSEKADKVVNKMGGKALKKLLGLDEEDEKKSNNKELEQKAKKAVMAAAMDAAMAQQETNTSQAHASNATGYEWKAATAESPELAIFFAQLTELAKTLEQNEAVEKEQLDSQMERIQESQEQQKELEAEGNTHQELFQSLDLEEDEIPTTEEDVETEIGPDEDMPSPEAGIDPKATPRLNPEIGADLEVTPETDLPLKAGPKPNPEMKTDLEEEVLDIPKNEQVEDVKGTDPLDPAKTLDPESDLKPDRMTEPRPDGLATPTPLQDPAPQPDGLATPTPLQDPAPRPGGTTSNDDDDRKKEELISEEAYVEAFGQKINAQDYNRMLEANNLLMEKNPQDSIFAEQDKGLGHALEKLKGSEAIPDDMKDALGKIPVPRPDSTPTHNPEQGIQSTPKGLDGPENTPQPGIEGIPFKPNIDMSKIGAPDALDLDQGSSSLTHNQARTSLEKPSLKDTPKPRPASAPASTSEAKKEEERKKAAGASPLVNDNAATASAPSDPNKGPSNRPRPTPMDAWGDGGH